MAVGDRNASIEFILTGKWEVWLKRGKSELNRKTIWKGGGGVWPYWKKSGRGSLHAYTFSNDPASQKTRSEDDKMFSCRWNCLLPVLCYSYSNIGKVCTCIKMKPIRYEREVFHCSCVSWRGGGGLAPTTGCSVLTPPSPSSRQGQVKYPPSSPLG